MTKLYAMDLQPYLDGSWRTLLPDLPDVRRHRILSCRFDSDRARLTGTGWLLRYALQEAGIDPKEHKFDKNEYGKPFLIGHPEIHYSLSHGSTWAVCAVGDAPLGVDVEFPRCTMQIANRYFRADELQGVGQLSILQQRDTLNRLWTGKEAFVKAVGLGLQLPLDSFRIELIGSRAILHQDHSPLPYRLHEYQPDLSRICLCTVDDKPELQIIHN